MTVENAIRILSDAAAGLELARHDLLEYTQWRQDSVRKLDAALIETDPFRCLHSAWLFAGDGGGRIMGLRCGEWAADQLLSKNSPETIIVNAESELAENVSRVFDISPVFGAKIEREIFLEDGVKLIPAEHVPPEWQAFNVFDNFTKSPFDPHDCCVLRQDVVISPAFAERASIHDRVTVKSDTVPDNDQRRAMRTRVREAMLLSCNSAIELPVVTRLGPPDRLLVVRGWKYGGLAVAMRLPSSIAIDVKIFMRNFEALGRFNSAEALARAVDRLGRARIGGNLTDVALDLGIATEVLLMHGTSSSNTEVTYKLAARAAWLIGRSVADRSATFDVVRQLYKARSDAVHSGKLSSRTTFDPQRSDELVRAAIEAVLLRGDFPDWEALTMGADVTAL